MRARVPWGGLIAAISFSALATACDAIRVAPVPGAGGGQTRSITPITSLATQEVCMLRFEEGYYDAAIDELYARGDLSDDEIRNVRAARVVAGMSEAAVQCAFGPPQEVLTRAIDAQYEMAWQYDRVFEGLETRVFFANGVAARVEDFPRANRGR